MSTDTAASIWQRMRALVLEEHDRRKDVRQALGISFIKAKALLRVAAGPLTMRELTEHLATDRPYTTLVVDDLERRGLVERTTSPDDRRCKLVTATPAGVAAAEVAERILNEPPDTVRALNEADLAELDRLLTKLTGY